MAACSKKNRTVKKVATLLRAGRRSRRTCALTSCLSGDTSYNLFALRALLTTKLGLSYDVAFNGLQALEKVKAQKKRA